MRKRTYQWTFVYAIGLSFLLLTSCGPQSKLHTAALAPAKEINYENETASPTVVIPKPTSPNDAKYQPLPKKIINKSKAEIVLGEAELHNTKISYNSKERKMIITGQAIIMNDSKEKIAEKSFSLSGVHDENQNQFILKEDELDNKTNTENKLFVGAQANCLGSADNDEINCNHVLVDVFISYNNKYYSEQIEMNRLALKPIIPIVTPPPSVEIPVQNENEDQVEVQQPEGIDDSIEGRYQGSAETIDLEQIFPKEESAPAAPDAITKPKDKSINPDLKQTKKGEIRPVNQAIGFPYAGRLRNATSILTRQVALKKKAFFEVIAPDRKKHFATYEMAELITKIGELLNKKYTKKLYVSNLSAINGGKLGLQLSHQNGLDADLAYPTNVPDIKFPLVVRMKTDEYFPKNYAVEKTYNLFKYLFTQKDVEIDRIFVDKKIKYELCRYAIEHNELQSQDKNTVQHMFENLQHVNGHGDHFHLRIKCSKFDEACRSRIYKKIEGCRT